MSTGTVEIDLEKLRACLRTVRDPERSPRAIMERHRRLPLCDRAGLFALAEELGTPDQAAALAARLVAADRIAGRGGP